MVPALLDESPRSNPCASRTIALQGCPKSGFRGSGCRISAGFRISAHSPIEKPRSILLRFNCCDSGAVCSFDVSPGHDANDEGDEACADAPPAGIGLAMQPRPEFDPDVAGAHEKDQTFEADIPPVKRLTL